MKIDPTTIFEPIYGEANARARNIRVGAVVFHPPTKRKMVVTQVTPEGLVTGVLMKKANEVGPPLRQEIITTEQRPECQLISWLEDSDAYPAPSVTLLDGTLVATRANHLFDLLNDARGQNPLSKVTIYWDNQDFVKWCATRRYGRHPE